MVGLLLALPFLLLAGLFGGLVDWLDGLVGRKGAGGAARGVPKRRGSSLIQWQSGDYLNMFDMESL